MVDVAVVGKGPIGAAAALMAERMGVSVAWLGREAVPVAAIGADADPADQGPGIPGSYALSSASRTLLDRTSSLGCPVAASGSRRFMTCESTPSDPNPVELHFGAYEGNTEALAWIVEGSNLNSGLRRAIGFSRIRDVDAQLEGLELPDGAPAALRLTMVRGLQARLVIGADGADSTTRATGRSELRRRIDYPQTAVVANFAISPAACRWRLPVVRRTRYSGAVAVARASTAAWSGRRRMCLPPN